MKQLGYFLPTTSHLCCNEMICEKPSCKKTSAERERQRADGFYLELESKPAINGPVFLKILMKCIKFTHWILSNQNKYLQFLFFFLLLNQIRFITQMSEKHGKQEKTKTCFALSTLKHFWSYCIITYIHYFQFRSTYWWESEIWPGIWFTATLLINIFSVVFPAPRRPSFLWATEKETMSVCGFCFLVSDLTRLHSGSHPIHSETRICAPFWSAMCNLN